MELTAQHGIINLIITLALYLGLLVSLTLLLNRKTLPFGLLSILALTSIGAALYVFSYWSTSQSDTESLVGWLFVPITVLLLSTGLLVRLAKGHGVSDLKSLLRSNVETHLPRALGLFISIAVIYAVICQILNSPFNLQIPYLATVLVTIAWCLHTTHKHA